MRIEPWLAALLVLAAVACQKETDRETKPPEAESPVPATPAHGAVERPSTVLISIDTLRSDRLPAYGYAAGATPAIDTLRADGVLFERAYSHVPLTLPSHASMLTGLLPPEHGVRDNLGYRLETADLPSLPALAKDAGYTTGAAVSAFVLRAETGIDAGFDFFDDDIEDRSGAGLGGLQRPGHETLDRVLSWLETAPRPFFLFVHFFEPHTPYEPPEPFASRFTTPYDGEIAAVDAIVGRLIERLRELELYDEAAVVLTSDHGEGLYDHGEQEHGIFLYREALQVPLILKLPKGQGAGAIVRVPVQLIDLAPTLAELWGTPASPRWQGASLVAVLKDNADAAERDLYAETWHPRLQYGWSELTSMVRGPLHFIHGPDPELYDLVADPGETKNVLGDHRRAAAYLRDRLAAVGGTFAPPAAIDPETLKKLAALGYVGVSNSPGGGPLRDPKREIETMGQIKNAFARFDAGDLEDAVEAFRTLTETQPGMVKAWELLGRSLADLGRPAPAMEAFQNALVLAPGSADVALQLATVHLELGHFEDARGHAALALEAEPVRAREILARTALAAEDFATAEKDARAVLEADAVSLEALLVLASALNYQDRATEAVDVLDRAAGEVARRQDLEEVETLHLLRGSALARLGDAGGAERELREEIRLFPAATRAYQELAMVYALEGRTDLTIATLRQMVEALESPAAYAAAVETLRVLNDPRSAEALLRRALRLFPDDATLRELAGG